MMQDKDDKNPVRTPRALAVAALEPKTIGPELLFAPPWSVGFAHQVLLNGSPTSYAHSTTCELRGLTRHGLLLGTASEQVFVPWANVSYVAKSRA